MRHRGQIRLALPVSLYSRTLCNHNWISLSVDTYLIETLSMNHTYNQMKSYSMMDVISFPRLTTTRRTKFAISETA